MSMFVGEMGDGCLTVSTARRASGGGDREKLKVRDRQQERPQHGEVQEMQKDGSEVPL